MQWDHRRHRGKHNHETAAQVPFGGGTDGSRQSPQNKHPGYADSCLSTMSSTSRNSPAVPRDVIPTSPRGPCFADGLQLQRIMKSRPKQPPCLPFLPRAPNAVSSDKVVVTIFSYLEATPRSSRLVNPLTRITGDINDTAFVPSFSSSTRGP